MIDSIWEMREEVREWFFLIISMRIAHQEGREHNKE